MHNWGFWTLMKIISAATAGLLSTVSFLALAGVPASAAPLDGRFEVAQAQQLTPEQQKRMQERKAQHQQKQQLRQQQRQVPAQHQPKPQVKKLEQKPAPKIVKPTQAPTPPGLHKKAQPHTAAPKTTTTEAPAVVTPKKLNKPPAATTTTTTPPKIAPNRFPKPVVATPPPTAPNAVKSFGGRTGTQGAVTRVQKGAYKQITTNRTTTVNKFVKVDQIRTNRQVKVEGGVKIITEPGNRTIYRENNRVFIRHNDNARFGLFGSNARTVTRANGLNVNTVVRPGGARIISVYDPRGNLVERRRWWNGHSVRLIDNRRVWGPGARIGLGVGVGLGLAALTVALAPPVFALPREKYIVAYDHASEADLYEALSAPPVERMDRRYTLDEIRYSNSLRERVRRIDVDGITFDTGSWEVTPDQYGKLERLAKVILRVLEKNPNAMIMVEGYTDAVGEPEDNLSLSDRRAESVATILTREFEVPPENLVTQGYGEQFLKVETQGAERANRRVTIRNVTDLMAQGEVRGRDDGGPDGPDGGPGEGPGEGPDDGPRAGRGGPGPDGPGPDGPGPDGRGPGPRHDRD